MIFLYLRRALLIAAAAAACYGLAEQFGARAAALIWVVAAGAACVLGVVFLRTSEIGRITWKNWLAGYLIPWGWRLNRGRLFPVAVISWVVWAAIGATVLVLRSGLSEEPPGVAVRVALFAAWAADVSALMFVLGSIRQATSGRVPRSLWKLSAVITLIVVASVGLYLGGAPTVALVVGGGPPAVVSIGMALFVLILMTVGRNARWN